jgi:phosphatidylserine/phosphatidylglycerophosphate/cardiolipin synthase-like enzyme
MPSHSTNNGAFLAELYPLAEQASRVLAYLADFPDSVARADSNLAARIGLVTAQHVAVVRRVLLEGGLAKSAGFAVVLVASDSFLRRMAANLEGVAVYQRVHKDRDSVRLVVTEPGENSRLRKALDQRAGLPPLLFQTSDAFINLARSAKRELIVLMPFIDDQGAEFLIQLFSLSGDGVERQLICRPLNEDHCGGAYCRRHADFRRLNVTVYEYAVPSSLPSGRETFHAKVILADDSTFYVGSSNLMGSALERSLECGVLVHGDSARHLHIVLQAIRSIATKPF